MSIPIFLKADILAGPNSRSDKIPPTYGVMSKNPLIQTIVGINRLSLPKPRWNSITRLHRILSSCPHARAGGRVEIRGTGLAMRSGIQQQRAPSPPRGMTPPPMRRAARRPEGLHRLWHCSRRRHSSTTQRPRHRRRHPQARSGATSRLRRMSDPILRHRSRSPQATLIQWRKHLEGSKNRWLMRLARDFRLLAI